MLKKLLKPYCLLCADYKGLDFGICDACLQALPTHTAAQCPQCALVSDGHICGHCLNAKPDFDATKVLFTYQYPVDALLQQYKYQDALQFGELFATLFRSQHPQASAHIDVLIPMPMHVQRLQERGFNQALEIARSLSRHWQLPLDFQACRRVKLTPPQAGLPLKDRVKNVRSVFECGTAMHGLRVAIVDDVMTTGASLNELAKTLKKAGAAHVECWVIARTLPG